MRDDERIAYFEALNPEMRQRLSDPVFGMTLTPLGSERFVEFIQSELNTWSPVIKAANIVMN